MDPGLAALLGAIGGAILRDLGGWATDWIKYKRAQMQVKIDSVQASGADVRKGYSPSDAPKDPPPPRGGTGESP